MFLKKIFRVKLYWDLWDCVRLLVIAMNLLKNSNGDPVEKLLEGIFKATPEYPKRSLDNLKDSIQRCPTHPEASVVKVEQDYVCCECLLFHDTVPLPIVPLAIASMSSTKVTGTLGTSKTNGNTAGSDSIYNRFGLTSTKLTISKVNPIHGKKDSIDGNKYVTSYYHSKFNGDQTQSHDNSNSSHTKVNYTKSNGSCTQSGFIIETNGIQIRNDNNSKTKGANDHNVPNAKTNDSHARIDPFVKPNGSHTPIIRTQDNGTNRNHARSRNSNGSHLQNIHANKNYSSHTVRDIIEGTDGSHGQNGFSGKTFSSHAENGYFKANGNPPQTNANPVQTNGVRVQKDDNAKVNSAHHAQIGYNPKANSLRAQTIGGPAQGDCYSKANGSRGQINSPHTQISVPNAQTNGPHSLMDHKAKTSGIHLQNGPIEKTYGSCTISDFTVSTNDSHGHSGHIGKTNGGHAKNDNHFKANSSYIQTNIDSAQIDKNAKSHGRQAPGDYYPMMNGVRVQKDNIAKIIGGIHDNNSNKSKVSGHQAQTDGCHAQNENDGKTNRACNRTNVNHVQSARDSKAKGNRNTETNGSHGNSKSSSSSFPLVCPHAERALLESGSIFGDKKPKYLTKGLEVLLELCCDWKLSPSISNGATIFFQYVACHDSFYFGYSREKRTLIPSACLGIICELERCRSISKQLPPPGSSRDFWLRLVSEMREFPAFKDYLTGTAVHLYCKKLRIPLWDVYSLALTVIDEKEKSDPGLSGHNFNVVATGALLLAYRELTGTRLSEKAMARVSGLTQKQIDEIKVYFGQDA